MYILSYKKAHILCTRRSYILLRRRVDFRNVQNRVNSAVFKTSQQLRVSVYIVLDITDERHYVIRVQLRLKYIYTLRAVFRLSRGTKKNAHL